jgi:hypothetical protein
MEHTSGAVQEPQVTSSPHELVTDPHVAPPHGSGSGTHGAPPDPACPPSPSDPPSPPPAAVVPPAPLADAEAAPLACDVEGKSWDGSSTVHAAAATAPRRKSAPRFMR